MKTQAIAKLAKITTSRYSFFSRNATIEFTRTDGGSGTLYPPVPDGIGVAWWGFERRIDVLGRSWTSTSSRYVVDNFGDLVQVAL